MRIAFISYEFPPDTGKGGIGTYVHQITAALAANNWDVHVFTATNKPENYFYTLNNVKVHRVVANSPQQFKLNVVNAFVSQHNVTAFSVIESAEIHGNAWEIKKAIPTLPLVVRLHAPNYLVESLKKKYIPFSAKLRFLLGALKKGKWDLGFWRSYNHLSDEDFLFTQLADGITAPSKVMKNWAVYNWKISPKKIKIIPNVFVASPAFLKMPISNTPHKKIVFFGRLNVLKGLVNATKAIKKILNKHTDWQFLVIGDDGLSPNGKQSLKQWMINELHPYNNRVIFKNGMHYDALASAIEKTDIVILPSLFESFSYTCVEAMAAGKAVVASKQTAMADLITHGKNGLLVDAYNVNSIYTAINLLITNTLLMQQISVDAKNTISNNFSNSSIQQSIQYYQLFKNCAKN
jgi:glycogen synthase